MKKILLLLIPTIILLFFTLGNTDKTTLYLLNWGEYIDPELLVKFEEEYQVTVVMDEVGSSEDMYQKIKAGTTSYDVAIPGDYMVEQMYVEGMIDKIDYSKVPNYKKDMFTDTLTYVRETKFFEENFDYCVPYFWGAYSIIYSTRNPIVEETIKANGFNALFDRSLFGSYADGVKIAMYDVPRFATTAYLLTQHKDINTTNPDDFNGCVEALKNGKYTLWGNDTIKKQVCEGNIDLGLVQLGDFFDQYYITTESEEEVLFSAFIPEENSVFFDAMVIPTTSTNKDLAHKFINFMLDTDNSFTNASYVGYTPTLKSVCEIIRNDEEFAEMLEAYPFYLDPFDDGSGVDPLDRVDKVSIFRYIDALANGQSYQDYLINIINKSKAN